MLPPRLVWHPPRTGTQGRGGEMPSNGGLLLYAAFVLVAQVVLLVEEVVQRQPAVNGDVLPGNVARPGIAEQEDRHPGDVGRYASSAEGDPRPQAGVLLDLLPGGDVLGRPD